TNICPYHDKPDTKTDDTMSISQLKSESNPITINLEPATSKTRVDHYMPKVKEDRNATNSMIKNHFQITKSNAQLEHAILH
ncbi:hypothetical protein Tco_0519987, partial [Tanacetum coccineum]